MIKKGIVFGIIILCIGAGFTSSISGNIKKYADFYSTYNLESRNGIISHWKFDEGSGNIAYDSAGENDGTINGATWTSDTPSYSGYALDFDGDYDYVIRNPVSNFPTIQITAAFWMKTSDTVQEGCPLSYASSSANNDFTIGDYKNFDIAIGDESIVDIGVSANDGNWHHIAITWKSSNGQVIFYKDGTVAFNGTIFIGGSITPNGSIVFGGDQDCIGGCWDSYQFFKGIIDDIRIFDRVLNDEEIQYLYDTPGSPDIVYVDDDFDENTTGWQIDHFDSIQEGIDAVNMNGIVYVFNGTYYENIIIDKTINLIGEDKNNTIIEGSGSGDTVCIIEDYVNMEQFSIKGSGDDYWNDAGIDIQGNSTSLFYNIIKENRNGIRLSGSHGSIIKSNSVIDNYDDGIRLHDSYFNNIIGNSVINNQDEGIELYNSTGNSIQDNTVFNNLEDGICLRYSSLDNIIIGNIVSSNNYYGIVLWDSSDMNTIIFNNIINNSANAYDECNNTWDNGYPSGGNYWDDYPYDDFNHGPNQDIPGHDRIGDIQYDLPCEHAVDYYPFMEPYGWLNEPPENITIEGPIAGKPGVEYSYTNKADEPDMDPIYFMFDWGDNTTSDWLGPYIPGTVASATHSWEEGTYNITVKAKDTRGLESEWSEPLVVTMPRDKSINNLFLRFLEKYPFLYQLLQLMLQRLGL